MLRSYVSNITKDAAGEIWTFYMSFIVLMKWKEKIISLVIQVGRMEISLFRSRFIYLKYDSGFKREGRKIHRQSNFFVSVRNMSIGIHMEY